MDKVIQFLIDCGLYTEDKRKILKGILEWHNLRNTLIILKDLKGIYGFARWNLHTLDTAYVIDVAIRKDKRRTDVLKQLIKLGVSRFPDLKYIGYERGLKKRNSFRVIEISKILKE